MKHLTSNSHPFINNGGRWDWFRALRSWRQSKIARKWNKNFVGMVTGCVRVRPFFVTSNRSGWTWLELEMMWGNWWLNNAVARPSPKRNAPATNRPTASTWKPTSISIWNALDYLYLIYVCLAVVDSISRGREMETKKNRRPTRRISMAILEANLKPKQPTAVSQRISWNPWNIQGLRNETDRNDDPPWFEHTPRPLPNICTSADSQRRQ